MTPLSQSEAQRIFEEVKRRSASDAQFRALALSDPIAAMAKVNPRPAPAGTVRFVQEAQQSSHADSVPDSSVKIIVLPPFEESLTLSDDELEKVAGGGHGPPVGFS